MTSAPTTSGSAFASTGMYLILFSILLSSDTSHTSSSSKSSSKALKNSASVNVVLSTSIPGPSTPSIPCTRSPSIDSSKSTSCSCCSAIVCASLPPPHEANALHPSPIKRLSCSDAAATVVLWTRKELRRGTASTATSQSRLSPRVTCTGGSGTHTVQHDPFEDDAAKERTAIPTDDGMKRNDYIQ